MEILFLAALTAAGIAVFAVRRLRSRRPIASAGAARGAPFEIRARAMQGADGQDVFAIEGRGALPAAGAGGLGIAISLLDVTETPMDKPVHAVAKAFQEEGTTAFQFRDETMLVSGEVHDDWFALCTVAPAVIVAPRQGRRELSAVARLYDVAAAPHIELGRARQSDPAILRVCTAGLVHMFPGQGYEDSAEERDQVLPLTVRLAVAVGMADGGMAEGETAVVERWLGRQFASLGGRRRRLMEKACGEALSEALAQAARGRLSLADTTARINAIADLPMKYEAIGLCLDVMAADGVADRAELSTIRQLAGALELDFDTYERLKNRRVAALAGTAGSSAAAE